MKLFKKNNLLKKIFISIFTAGIFALTSCGANTAFVANSDKSVNMSVSIQFGKGISSVLNAFTSTSDLSKLLPDEEMIKGFQESDITLTKAQWLSSSSLVLSGTIAAPEKQKYQLSDSNLMVKDFVNCQDKSLTLTLSPQTIQAFVSALPEEGQALLYLSMAPVFTGEKVSRAEYEELISSFYGNELDSELKAGSVNITLGCPSAKKITSFTEGKISSDSKSLSIELSLLEFFTLDTSKVYKITW